MALPASERCTANVWHRIGMWGQHYQCEKKAVRDGFCGTHHPDAKKKREEQGAARAKARRQAWDRDWAEERRRSEIDDCSDCKLCAKHAPVSEPKAKG